MYYKQGGMSISMSRTPKKRNKTPYWKRYLNIKKTFTNEDWSLSQYFLDFFQTPIQNESSQKVFMTNYTQNSLYFQSMNLYRLQCFFPPLTFAVAFSLDNETLCCRNGAASVFSHIPFGTLLYTVETMKQTHKMQIFLMQGPLGAALWVQFLLLGMPVSLLLLIFCCSLNINE